MDASVVSTLALLVLLPSSLLRLYQSSGTTTAPLPEQSRINTMAQIQETSRRVSISALPASKERNSHSSRINARQLTPFAHRVPNSLQKMGRTPHNSYAPECSGGAASPRHIGNLPLNQAGAGSLQLSLVAHRLRALRNVRSLEDQENSSGEESPEASLAYRPKLVDASASVKQITERLAKQGFDPDGAQR